MGGWQLGCGIRSWYIWLGHLYYWQETRALVIIETPLAGTFHVGYRNAASKTAVSSGHQPRGHRLYQRRRLARLRQGAVYQGLPREDRRLAETRHSVIPWNHSQPASMALAHRRSPR